MGSHLRIVEVMGGGRKKIEEKLEFLGFLQIVNQKKKKKITGHNGSEHSDEIFPTSGGFLFLVNLRTARRPGVGFHSLSPSALTMGRHDWGGPSTVQDGEQSRRNSCGLIKG